MAISTQTRITRARIQLCMRKPYLSTALMRFPLVQADGIIETICTDGYHIFWSESFIDSLTDAELRGVLAHELMHVITQAGRNATSTSGTLRPTTPSTRCSSAAASGFPGVPSSPRSTGT